MLCPGETSNWQRSFSAAGRCSGFLNDDDRGLVTFPPPLPQTATPGRSSNLMECRQFRPVGRLRWGVPPPPPPGHRKRRKQIFPNVFLFPVSGEGFSYVFSGTTEFAGKPTRVRGGNTRQECSFGLLSRISRQFLGRTGRRSI